MADQDDFHIAFVLGHICLDEFGETLTALQHSATVCKAVVAVVAVVAVAVENCKSSPSSSLALDYYESRRALHPSRGALLPGCTKQCIV